MTARMLVLIMALTSFSAFAGDDGSDDEVAAPSGGAMPAGRPQYQQQQRYYYNTDTIRDSIYDQRRFIAPRDEREDRSIYSREDLRNYLPKGGAERGGGGYSNSPRHITDSDSPIRRDDEEVRIQSCKILDNALADNVTIYKIGEDGGTAENTVYHYKISKGGKVISTHLVDGMRDTPSGIPTVGQKQDRSFIRKERKAPPGFPDRAVDHNDLNLTFEVTGSVHAGTLRFAGVDESNKPLNISSKVSCF